MLIHLDWFPDELSLVYKFAEQDFLLDSFMTVGPDFNDRRDSLTLYQANNNHNIPLISLVFLLQELVIFFQRAK